VRAMFSVTWVELVLGTLFFGALAYSVRFCLSNYASDKKHTLREDAVE
jgi:hypothetical protein